MPKTRLTMWMDRRDLEGHDRYTAKNPRFRVWMMLIAVMVVAIGMVMIFFFMPKSSTHNVHFSSIPPGASVYLEETIIGTTPFSKELDEGFHQLRIETEGFLPIEQKIEVTPTNTSVNIVFSGGETKVAFTSSPESVSVFLNDKFIGKTPFIFRDVADGNPVTIKAEKSGFRSIEIIEDLTSKTEIKLALEQIMLAVGIDSDPSGAELYIDGKHVGQTPWMSKLPFGEHKIRLAKDDVIEETIDLKTDIEIMYPFKNTGIKIKGFLGEINTPGARIFVLPVKNYEIQPGITPLRIKGTTPTQIEQNDIATYLTMDKSIPDKALFIGIRDGISATMMMVDVSKTGELTESEVNLQFSAGSQIDFLGQSLSGIDWFSLLSEQPKSNGSIKNNPQFTIKGNRIIDRDNPEKSFTVNNSEGLLFLSPELDYLAVQNNKTIRLYDYKKQINIFTGDHLVFSSDNVYLFITSGSKLTRYEIITGKVATLDMDFVPTSIVAVSNWVIVNESNGAISLVNSSEMKITGWSAMLPDDPESWAQYFVPEGIFTRNIIGVNHVLLLGRVFGLKVIVTVDDRPSLLNVWFDVDPMLLTDFTTQ